jgi:hypothetical protein
MGAVRERSLVPVGRQIQKLGFERHSDRDASYYDSAGIETMFTGVDSIAIDVPGYSATSEKDEIRRLMGHNAYAPADREAFIDRTQGEFDRKRTALLDAIDTDVVIVMCYLYSLDATQHVFWTDDSVIESWYQQFDDLARDVVTTLAPTDSFIIMSDHGMPSEAAHNENAFYSCNVELFPDTTPHITDFHDRILDLTGAGEFGDLDI